MTTQAKRLLTTEAKKFLREDRVFVYQYRPNGSPVVKDGLAVIPRRELEEILRSHPTLQASPVPIAPRARSVDIHQQDLMPKQPAGAPLPGNAASNVAGVQMPLLIWLEGLLRGKGQGWKEVVVVSERMGAF